MFVPTRVMKDLKKCAQISTLETFCAIQDTNPSIHSNFDVKRTKINKK